ncbi:MAG: MarR family winged helix-turn-helix transcriptional regulator [Bacteroidota bacterium]
MNNHTLESSLSLLHQIFRNRKSFIEKKYKINAFEMDLIIFLEIVGVEKMKEIAEYFRMKLSTLTNAIDKSEQKGILKRNYSRTDRRIVKLKVTAKGKRLYQQYQEDLKLIASRMTENWSDKNIADFETCLKSMQDLKYELE